MSHVSGRPTGNAVMHRKHTAQLNSFEPHFPLIYLYILDKNENF